LEPAMRAMFGADRPHGGLQQRAPTAVFHNAGTGFAILVGPA